MRPTAPNAPLRPFQIASDSSGGLRDLQADRLELLADRGESAEQPVLFLGAAFDLDDQHGFGVERIAGVGERLAGVDRGAVHEFQRHRNDAGGDDRVDRGAGDFVGGEGGEHGAGALGAAQDADGDLGDDGEHALAAGEQPEPVVAGGVEVSAADVEDFAVDGDDLQAQQVVGGDAVFKAVGAAGVHVDVAADHAGELAGWVGRVEEAVGGDRVGDADIGDAGLHGGAAVGVIDVEDLVHPHHADDDRVLQRQGAAGERGAGAAGDDAHAVAVAEAQDGGDLFGGFGQDDGERQLAVGGEAVGLVGFEAERLADEAASGEQGGRPATMLSRRAITSGFGAG